MHSASTSDERAGRRSDGFDRPDFLGASSRSTRRALRTLIRRVLRTQSQRTWLEKLVCREARRINHRHFPPLSRETVIGLVIDKLERQLPVRFTRSVSSGDDSVRTTSSPTVVAPRRPHQ